MGRPKKRFLGAPSVHKGEERVWWNGEWIGLGPAGSKEAEAAYPSLSVRIAADPTGMVKRKDDYLVAELFADYLASSDCPGGGPQRERVETAAELLLDLYPDTAAIAFGVADLETWQAWLCGLTYSATHRKAGEKRFNITSIKDMVWVVRRVWKWGTRKRGLPVERYQELMASAWPKFGEARPARIVEPANLDHVRATLPHLRPPVRTMVVLQLACGARPSELCGLRAGDVVRSGKVHIIGAGVHDLDQLGVWVYVLKQHKGTWRGKPRWLTFGPDLWPILEPYLNRPADAFCFSPKEAMLSLRQEQRAEREARGGGSGGNRKRPIAETEDRIRDHYDSRSYRQAVERACLRAQVPHWFPYQLRHATAAEVKTLFGTDAVQALLGHHTKTMAEHYGGVAFKTAAEVAKKRSTG